MYSNLTQDILTSNHLIVNATPTGTFPNINDFSPIPMEFLTSQHLIYDLIYNPEETKLLQLGKKSVHRLKTD